MINGHLLWTVAFLLMNVLAVAIGYWDILTAIGFWAFGTLVLFMLRPE